MERRKKYKVNYSKLVISITVILLVILGTVFGISKAFNNDKDIDIYADGENKIEEEIVKEPEEYKLTISAGGDLLIHDTVFKSVKNADGTYNFDPIFADIKYVFEESDVSMINLEVPVAGNI